MKKYIHFLPLCLLVVGFAPVTSRAFSSFDSIFNAVEERLDEAQRTLDRAARRASHEWQELVQHPSIGSIAGSIRPRIESSASHVTVKLPHADDVKADGVHAYLEDDDKKFVCEYGTQGYDVRAEFTPDNVTVVTSKETQRQHKDADGNAQYKHQSVSTSTVAQSLGASVLLGQQNIDVEVAKDAVLVTLEKKEKGKQQDENAANSVRIYKNRDAAKKAHTQQESSQSASSAASGEMNK